MVCVACMASSFSLLHQSSDHIRYSHFAPMLPAERAVPSDPHRVEVIHHILVKALVDLAGGGERSSHGDRLQSRLEAEVPSVVLRAYRGGP